MKKEIIIILLFGVAIILALIGVEARYWSFKHHFTHVDDFLVAENATYTVNKRIVDSPFTSEIKGKKSDTPESIEQFGKLKRLISKPTFGFAFYALRLTSYGPLQFFFTAYSIRHLSSAFDSVIIANRLPSFIASVACLLMIFVLIGRFTKGQMENENEFGSWAAKLFGLAILSVSWQGIIYAGHGSNYAFSILIMAVIIYLLSFEYKSNLHWFLLSAFIVLLMLGSYQVIFILPGLYLVLIFKQYLIYKRPLYKLGLKAYLQLSSFVFTTSVFSYIIRRFFIKHRVGVSWNAGPNHEFVFNLPNSENLIEKIFYVAKFFTYNTFISIGSLISNTPYDHIYWKIFFIFFISLIAVGVIKSIRSKNPILIQLIIFSFTYFFTFIAMVVVGKLTLGPTRHILFIFPLLLVLSSIGLYFLFNMYFNRFKVLILTILITFLISHTIFFYLYNQQIRDERRNKVNIQEVLSIAKKYDVQAYIEHRYSHNLSIELNRVPPHTVNVYKTLPKRLLVFSTKGRYGETIGGKDIHNLEYIRNSTLIYSIANRSDVEVDFFPLTKNGTNDYYIDVYQYNSKLD